MRDMFKGKSFWGIIVAVFRRMGLYINKFFYLICLLVPVDEKRILLESEGDFCDNAFALYETMVKNGLNKCYKIVWAAKDIKNYPNQVEHVISKKNYIPSIRRMLCLARTKYCIYDHQNIMEPFVKRKAQCYVFLSHGCGFKAAKGKRAKNNKIDIMYATSPLFYKSAANFAGCEESILRDLGLPRNDYLLSPPHETEKYAIQKMGLTEFKAVIFWMPTFRSSAVKSISEGYTLGETGLPILYTKDDLYAFNTLLESLDVLCIIKVHHLQAELPVFKEKLSNVRVLLDEDVRCSGLQLYQILKYSDMLITDYSSIATDYYLLDKPIIYTLDDFEKYMGSRGFYPENPIKYFVGYHVFNVNQLASSIKEICEGKDSFKDKRGQIQRIMHTYMDNCSGERILHDLKML